MKLKIRLITGRKERISSTVYKTEIDATNYKEINRVLIDLKNLNLPVEKAIKEFNLLKSDWDASLRF